MQCKRKFVLDQKYSGDLNTEADKVVCQEYENGLLCIAPMPIKKTYLTLESKFL